MAQTPFGTTRSHLARNHALLTPESHVGAPRPGWQRTVAVTHISPRIGAGFWQLLARLEALGSADPAPPGVQRFVLVLEGAVQLRGPSGAPEATLAPDDFAYLPPDGKHGLATTAGARLLVVEKPYVPLAGVAAPVEPLWGPMAAVEARPFLGDPAARLQTLLPDDERFDIAMNVFTFDPGACLPLVEMHVMEHGLLLLEGAGIYRLGEAWYPVQAGDAIWMAPYCPQWFAAVGRTPARYVYYKDSR